MLSFALDFVDISIIWKLKLAPEFAKAPFLLLLPPVHLHLFLLALTTHNQLAVLVYLYLQQTDVSIQAQL